jgi:uncharacterized protein YbaP (TraB family)
MRGTNKAGLLLASLALIGAAPGASAQQAASAEEAQAEELVVTARRIGIPVWRVHGPRTSMVLVGSIQGVAKGTRWDPGALATTLRKADRVMFPDTVGMAISPVSMIGYYMKWRSMATLPKGQNLAQLMPADQFQRLVALRNRGVLKPGFERRHPLHLAIQLRNKVQREKDEATGVDGYVRHIVKKEKLKQVPITMLKAKSVARDFFATPARAYVPCLIASMNLVEAGPAAVRARSQAWAERRVPEVLASPADKIFDVCLPPAFEAADRPDIKGQMRRLLAEPQLTVAVVGLRSLAEPGGVLNSLAAAGFKVTGPRWKA